MKDSETKRGPGRPELEPSEQKQRRNYTLSQEFLQRLDTIIPSSKRSLFMERAANYMLDVLEGKRSIDDGAEDIKKDFDN